MKKLLLCLAVAGAAVAQAQQFEVVDLQQVKTGITKVYHPRFMPDGKTLLVTSEDYNGLGLVDIEKQSYTKLTDMQGAGYYPVISADGKTILTRSMNQENFTQTLYAMDVETKGLTVIAKDIDHVNQIALNNGEAAYATKGAIVGTVVTNPLTPVRRQLVHVTEEDLKIVVYKGNTRTVLDPLAGQFGAWDPQYSWTSLSPDRTKILFHCRNYAYICDLNGGNVVKLGSMRAPQWRGNTHVVGMNDEHDGYFNTKSDVVIVRNDGTQMQQLTAPSDEIKMFPSVSADGSQIAFHTEKEGKVYVMTIKEK